jgi:hypothetical protein
MNSDETHLGSSRGMRVRANPFLRGFIDCAAGLLDIFGSGRSRTGTPVDDARELRADVARIAEDFHAVFARIDSTAKK